MKKCRIQKLLIILLMLFLWRCDGPPDIDDLVDDRVEVDDVIVTVSDINSRPVADAGDSRTILITEASAVVLKGNGSFDQDGDALSFSWISADKGITFSPDNTSVSPTVSMTNSGTYVFVLVVSDGNCYSIPDTVTITVKDPDGWVDDDYEADMPDDSRFKTITSALTYLGNEKLILVYPGTYEEHVNVSLGVHLFGAVSQQGRMPEITSSVDDSEGSRAVVYLNSGSTLENLIISCQTSPESDDGLSIVSIREDSDQVVIQNCRIKSADGYRYSNYYVDGIRINPNAQLTLTGRTIVEDLTSEGILALDNTNLTVEDSRLGKTDGSVIWALGNNRAVFTNSCIYHAGYGGLDLTSDHIEIDHCTIAGFSEFGINVQNVSAEELIVTNNILYSVSYNKTPYTGGISNADIDTTNLPNRDTDEMINPLFIDFMNADFHLESDSPAMGIGTNGTNAGAEGSILSP